MTLPREVIESVFRRCETAEQAADLIERYERIRSRVVERSRKITMMRSKTEEDIRKLNEETLCDHPLRKYHGDPSGGSDSHESCLVCGETIPDKGYRRS